MISYTKNGRILSGKLAQIERDWRKGHISQATYCLALQYIENGFPAFRSVPENRQREIIALVG